MPMNKARRSIPRPRMFGKFSHPEQKSRDALLRSAWIAIPEPLHSRPEPRSAWDSAARADCPTSPWEKLTDPLRCALRAAVRTGDPQKIKSVTIHIEHFFALMQADVISVLPLLDEATILRVAILETEAQGSADVAIQEVIADPTPCPAKLERAERTLAHHESTIRRCRTMVGSLLRNGTRPQLKAVR